MTADRYLFCANGEHGNPDPRVVQASSTHAGNPVALQLHADAGGRFKPVQQLRGCDRRRRAQAHARDRGARDEGGSSQLWSNDVDISHALQLRGTPELAIPAAQFLEAAPPLLAAAGARLLVVSGAARAGVGHGHRRHDRLGDRRRHRGGLGRNGSGDGRRLDRRRLRRDGEVAALSVAAALLLLPAGAFTLLGCSSATAGTAGFGSSCRGCSTGAGRGLAARRPGAGSAGAGGSGAAAGSTGAASAGACRGRRCGRGRRRPRRGGARRAPRAAGRARSAHPAAAGAAPGLGGATAAAEMAAGAGAGAARPLERRRAPAPASASSPRPWVSRLRRSPRR